MVANTAGGLRVYPRSLLEDIGQSSNVWTEPFCIIDADFFVRLSNGSEMRVPYSEKYVKEGASALVITLLNPLSREIDSVPIDGLENITSFLNDLGLNATNVSKAKGTRVIAYRDSRKLYGISLLYH